MIIYKQILRSLFITLYIVIAFTNNICKADSLDSLFITLNKSKDNQDKVIAMSKIAYEYTNINIDSALIWVDKSLALSQKIKYKRGIATSLSIKGIINEIQGNYESAIENHLNCLKISEQLHDTNNIASSLNNIAIVYDYMGNYQKSLDYQYRSLNFAIMLKDSNSIANSYLNIGIVYYYLGIFEKALDFTFKGLKIEEKTKNGEMQVNYLNNIGMIYGKQKKYDKALDYYFKTIKIYTANNNLLNLADAYNNIGVTYLSLNQFDTALVYLEKSKILKEEVGHTIGIAQALSNIGLVYKAQKKYKLAIDYYKKALEIQTKIGDKNGIVNILVCFGDLYFEIKEYENARINFTKAEILGKEIGANDLILSAYSGLSKVYYKTSEFKKAYDYKELHTILKDSLNSYENNQKMIRLESDYEYEKKQEAINFENKKRELAAATELQKQKLYRNFYFFGFGIMVLLSIVIYRSYRHKKKANRILSEQKRQIEEKNEELKQQKEEIATQRDLVTTQKEEIEIIHHELTDSIHYARRIQTAVLPTFDIFEKSGLEYFVLYKPRNIVSGDFYWATEIKNKLVFCVADCTGHGVPGAFMSMLGISLLNEIVKKEHTTDAAHILNQLRENVINSLQQQGVSGEQKDGMDITLCVYHKDNNLLQFSGANNPLYLVSKNVLAEIKADKMPIAIYEKMEPFTNTDFQLDTGDILYLSSDGFADQFGGPKGRKFMYKQFKDTLMTNSMKPMKEQGEILNNVIQIWMDKNEQVDDITILGLKIN